MRLRSTSPRFTRSSTTGVRLDLSRPLASDSSVWLMPGLRPIKVSVANRPGLSPISCERRENASKAASCAMRRLKPTQPSSGPKSIAVATVLPLLLRRTTLLLPATSVAPWSSHPAGALAPRPRISLISNDPLYNRAGIRLNIAKELATVTNIRRREEVRHEGPLHWLCLRRGNRRHDRLGRRARAREDLRSQDLALGAAVASTAEGARGMGRRCREGVRRHDPLQGVPGAAARQGVRPLRHGARRHCRPHLH